MSHLVETMAYAGELPWHGLGKPVSPNLTPDEMLVEAGLDWRVNKIPAYADINGKKVSVDRCALVRDSDDKILSIVGDDWNEVQNSEAFQFFDDFVKAGGMEMHTAGSLDEGRSVWALAKIKESFTLFGKDEVESFILFSNPHQFGKSIDVRFTPIRVVCNNTLTLALSKQAENGVRVSHRTAFDASKVTETLGLASNKLGQYKEMAEFLGSVKYKEEDIVSYFKRLFPVMTSKSDEEIAAGATTKDISKAAALAMDIIETQPGAEFAKGSWWQPFNSVTYMVDHLAGRSANTRLKSAWYGGGRNKKLEALNMAIDFAKAA